MNLLKALATVSSMTLVSRILGFIRDVVIARLFGAGLATDAFFVAFRIPNLLFRPAGRHSHCVEPLCDPRSPPFRAYSRFLFWRLVLCFFLRPAGDGACLGGIRRRGAAARAAGPGAREDRHAAAAAALLHRPPSAAETFICGGRPARPFRGSGHTHDQSEHRAASWGVRPLLSLLRRPAHGISDRAPGRGARDGSPAEPVEVSLGLG